MSSVFSKIFGCRPSFDVYGEQGGISVKLTLPEGFNPARDHCPAVILMHGFMANKNMNPNRAIAKALAREGIASICFDFNAHGKSEGKFEDMTIANEISDALAVLDYTLALPYVTSVGFVGHSQGGVIAGMLAGQLENDPRRPSCVALLAPAAVLKDDAIAGHCMTAHYDPVNPPEYVNVLFHRLGRTFIRTAQVLPLYETSLQYTGPVCLMHGTADKIVPFSYSERYHNGYNNSTLHALNDGHFLKNTLPQILATVVQFCKDNLF